jgi:predicted amidohydrolase
LTALTLAVVQFTPQFGEKQKNLLRMQELVKDISADIIVFPELCTTGYFFTQRQQVARVAEAADGETVAFFRAMAAGSRAVVVAGFAESHKNKLYNSCLIVIPEVENTYIYRKIHLFYKEQLCFDPGQKGFFVIRDEQRDLRIGPMICYDWRFPESARILNLLGADLITCPANLVTDAWKTVMPARAIENKVYLALANRAGSETKDNETLTFKGGSAIYDFNGNEIQKAGPTDDEVLLATIHPQQTRDKSFNAFNDIFADRKPHLYDPLVAPKGSTERTP